MNPSTKRNLLIGLSTVFYVALLLFISKFGSFFGTHIQHLEFIGIALMVLLSLVVMLFWGLSGVIGGLLSFLVAIIFLYGVLMDLSTPYYTLLIAIFSVNSFIGYYIYRRTNMSSQEHTVRTEKIREDVNLIRDHMKNRAKEISAMGKKMEGLLRLKNIADRLSLTLSYEEIIKIVTEETLDAFGEGKRVLLFILDPVKGELNLSFSSKALGRKHFGNKKGDIFDRWVIKNAKSLLVKDVNKDFRFSVEEEGSGDDAISIIIKPLMVKNDVLGILRVDSDEIEAFGQHELRILDIIGELAAVALENARLFYQTQELAIKDSLTGLYVHRYFMERLGEEVKRALRSDIKFALMMIDIDNFKKFNDKHGHMSGDIVLKNVGRILSSKISAGDIVARYGGEEFVMVVLNCDREGAVKLANEIREDIKNTPVVLRREEWYVTVSIGISVLPDDAKLKDDLIWEADRRLYDAKAKGKDRVCSE
ncbi:MAG: diguanylate cyclase [Candidatus Omnitrophica bacterium]|nr:diguanylate cyclase [Candidatus Omnitrophota bacterium]MDD5488149.1 diguanylate cyclase [Candidatus Omnitrophota bacterium]